MKLFLYSFIVLSLTGCLNGEERFVCEGNGFAYKNNGLVIKNNNISFLTNSNTPFCKKEGLLNFYSTDCSYSFTTKEYSSFQFDTVSYKMTYTWSSGGQFGNDSYQCKKVN